MNFQKKILFIGNDPQGLNESFMMLNQSGNIVLSASDGNEGFLKARCELPDLIICKSNLPDMRGVDLCQRIRNDEQLCRVPFILTNKHLQDIDQVIRDLEIGLDDYLTVCFNLGLPTAKVMWFLGQTDWESSFDHSYQIIYSRHQRLKEIIKNTIELIDTLIIELHLNVVTNKQNWKLENSLSQRIKSGMTIIDELNWLLIEQTSGLTELAETLEKEVNKNSQYNYFIHKEIPIKRNNYELS